MQTSFDSHKNKGARGQDHNDTVSLENSGSVLKTNKFIKTY